MTTLGRADGDAAAHIAQVSGISSANARHAVVTFFAPRVYIGSMGLPEKPLAIGQWRGSAPLREEESLMRMRADSRGSGAIPKGFFT